MSNLRPEFEKANARLTVVSAQEKGAQEFIDAVWQGGEMWIDEEEAFKKALGGQTYRTWWLLKPSVLKNILSFASRFGSSTSDVTDVKTQTLGGTIVVKDGKVVYAHQETKSFDNGDAKEMLAAVLGKSVAELGDLSISATPAQVDEVCTRPQK